MTTSKDENENCFVHHWETFKYMAKLKRKRMLKKCETREGSLRVLNVD